MLCASLLWEYGSCPYQPACGFHQADSMLRMSVAARARYCARRLSAGALEGAETTIAATVQARRTACAALSILRLARPRKRSERWRRFDGTDSALRSGVTTSARRTAPHADAPHGVRS